MNGDLSCTMVLLALLLAMHSYVDLITLLAEVASCPRGCDSSKGCLTFSPHTGASGADVALDHEKDRALSGLNL
jgi:hypothetical protein